MLPKIRIDFYLESDTFDVKYITKKLGVTPTRIREKSDWPTASIVANIATTEWSYSTEDKEFKSVELPFEEIIEKLFGKANTINDLCRECNLKTGFVVVIKAEVGDLPEMVLTKGIISFAASINAEIGFDMYID